MTGVQTCALPIYQAVIAIENVRLFQELQARTRDLSRSVEELQALSAVSRAVSSTLDLETVLNTLVARAVQLDRKSVLQGKSVSVRVELGRRRILTTNTQPDDRPSRTIENH